MLYQGHDNNNATYRGNEKHSCLKNLETGNLRQRYQQIQHLVKLALWFPECIVFCVLTSVSIQVPQALSIPFMALIPLMRAHHIINLLGPHLSISSHQKLGCQPLHSGRTQSIDGGTQEYFQGTFSASSGVMTSVGTDDRHLKQEMLYSVSHLGRLIQKMETESHKEDGNGWTMIMLVSVQAETMWWEGTHGTAVTHKAPMPRRVPGTSLWLRNAMSSPLQI